MGEQPTIAQAHDHLFKLLLEQPGVADALLRERLPPVLVAQLADGEPELVPATFVSEGLRETRADRRFRLRLRDEASGSVQCVVEHKSALEPHVDAQLLGYLAAAYAHPNDGEPRPLVLALVVYHGAARWTGPRRFADGLAIDEALRPFALDFPIEVFDVGQVPPAQVSSNRHLRGALLLLHYAVCPPQGNLEELLVFLLEDLRGMADSFLEAVGTYAFIYFPGIRFEELRMAIVRVMPEKEELMLSTAAEQTRAEGKEEGAILATTRLLVTLLERRFGPVSPELARRIEQADLPLLELWFRRAIDAVSLEAVFDESDT